VDCPVMSQGEKAKAEPIGALSASEEENLDVLATVYEREDAELSGVQVIIERVSAFFGSPAYFAFAVAFIVLWIVVNCVGMRLGWPYLDRPPFFWLQGIVSANALLLTIAVLIRQNRMAQQAGHRAHLDLQINLLTEQKVSKVLEVLHGQDRGPASSSAAHDSEAAPTPSYTGPRRARTADARACGATAATTARPTARPAPARR
jgi:uncharacterized membrane protein